ncbi:MAG TPA: hypothetical protein VFK79_05145 [Xanthobacteraceae bacterium]|nr:hypothetical protein [Xanthobacteraceae bacterium]
MVPSKNASLAVKHAKAMEIARRSFRKHADIYKAFAKSDSQIGSTKLLERGCHDGKD